MPTTRPARRTAFARCFPATTLLPVALLPVALLLALPAAAQPAPGGGPAVEPRAETSDQPAAQSAERDPSVAPLLGPVGSLFGARDALEARGLEFSLTYTGEVLGLVSGGARRGAIHEGRADLQVDLDLGRALGWEGGKVHFNVFQIHGRGLSRYHVGNILTASGIEALPSTRLYELWFEQSFPGGSLRLGQLAADTEFQVSQYASLFVNSTFGWPASSGANLPSGGPAYPLATPGIRLRLDPAEGWTVLAAAFNGDPAGPGTDDPQRRDRDGLRFRLRDAPFLIAEARYAYQGPLPGRVNLGAWHHFGRFDDLRVTQEGLSLADPDASATPRRRRGNTGLYAGLDGALWRGEGEAGIGAFLRVAGSPGDRDLVSLYADGGLVARGLVPGRPDDTAGIAVAYARIGDATRGLDRDSRALGAFPDAPVRSSELLFEATYQASVVPGWTVQPVAQHVVRPGGGAIAPRADGDPPRRAGNATILGLRTTIRF